MSKRHLNTQMQDAMLFATCPTRAAAAGFSPAGFFLKICQEQI